jgi:hypothetical protein
MQARVFKQLLRAKVGAAALLAAGVVVAGQLSVGMTVKVRLVSSSGACGATAVPPAVQVGCQPPKVHVPQAAPAPAPPAAAEREFLQDARGPLLPDAGAVPYQRVGTIQATGVALQPLPVYSDGTKITSWRVVTLDNARYVELTIAW